MEFPENINLRLTPRTKLIVEAIANIDGKSQQEVIRAAIAESYSQRSNTIDNEIRHIESLRKAREAR